jgi:regulator of sigma E protease
MLTLIAGIVMLGILVFIHELGHFCVAKLAGVKVLKFSLGFGPRLVSRHWGETEYMICAIPLGGYVQMLGEGSGEGGEGGELTPEERQRSFADKPVLQRTAIIAAGPLMNLLLPFVILPVAFMVGVNLPAFLEQPTCIGYVVANSQGAEAGFQPGDCILAINDEPVATWTDTSRTLISHAGSPLVFTLSRGGETTSATLTPADGGIEGLQSFGLLPRQEALVGATSPGMPAAAAGLQAGDRIVAIDKTPVTSWYDLRTLIQNSEGNPQTFAVERDAQILHLSIKPIRQEADGADYLVGIVPHQESVFKRFGFIEAVRAGADRTLELVELTLVFIKKLFAGHVSTKNIGGPITVVQIAGQAAQTDLASILTILAFLSIQLGILNLFPIPILDGGHLFFNLFEIVLRRPLSLRVREIAQQVGLALLIMLMLLAFYNDIVRIFIGGQ